MWTDELVSSPGKTVGFPCVPYALEEASGYGGHGGVVGVVGFGWVKIDSEG